MVECRFYIPMKSVSYITVAMMKDPVGSSWAGQVHVEYEGTSDKAVLPIKADSPMGILEKARNALDKKLSLLNGKVIALKP